MTFDIFQKILIWAIPVIFAITVHETMHGWVALHFGDRTAKRLGRLTLNPIKHVSVVGTIIIPLLLLISHAGFVFGWAKPVPVDYRNLRNPRLHSALVAAAGPVSNIVMAVLWAVIAKMTLLLATPTSWNAAVLLAMSAVGIWMNIMLAVLNLLPIPPLDGSRVVSSLLNNEAAEKYNRLERYGFIVLLALLLLGWLSKILIMPVVLMVSLIAYSFGIDFNALMVMN